MDEIQCRRVVAGICFRCTGWARCYCYRRRQTNGLHPWCDAGLWTRAGVGDRQLGFGCGSDRSYDQKID
eukprot:5559734-Lingulodinium_polyedra.AAC.1